MRKDRERCVREGKPGTLGNHASMPESQPILEQDDVETTFPKLLVYFHRLPQPMRLDLCRRVGVMPDDDVGRLVMRHPGAVRFKRRRTDVKQRHGMSMPGK